MIDSAHIACFDNIELCARSHKTNSLTDLYFAVDDSDVDYNALLLSGKLWTYLADLNEQAADRLACIVSQMQEAEGVTEELKARDQLAWVGAMNSIRSRAEEIILSEMIFV